MDRKKFADIYQNIQPSPMLQIFEASAKVNDLVNLGIGEPDFHTDEKIVEAAYKAGLEGFTHYAPTTGFLDLRQEVVSYWDRKYGLKSTPGEVMITVGAIQAIYLALQTIINPGDEVIVTDPCFTPYLQIIDYVYGKAVSVPVYEENGFNMTAEDLEKYITPKTKVILLNSPNNPTGAVMSREELEKIAKLVEKYDLMVISDEVYEAFLFEGEHVCFATLPGMKDRTFTVAGFSKTYAMTGWRIGYAIAPPEVIRVMGIIGIAQTMCVNSMTQKAALYAMQNFEEKAAEMINVYKERVDYTVERLNKLPGVSCIKPKGSFYVFANIKNTGMKSMEFALKMIDEARVSVIPGISFGKNADDFVRIACTVPVDKLDLAFTRLEDALTK